MIRYLVKETSVATKENRNFAGQELIGYFGKGDKMLAYFGSHAKATHTEMDFDIPMIIEYGYKRKCDAARCWTYKNPDRSEFWDSEVEIVEMEV